MKSRPLRIGTEVLETENSEAVFNPWNGEHLADIGMADASQVERTVALSHAVFGKTRTATAAERSALLLRVAAGIQHRRQEFVETIVAEAGKPVIFAEIEVDRAQMTFEQAAHEAAMSRGHGLPMDATAPGKNHFGLVERFPVGVILGITPFNFPLNLVAHKVAPCLATGNTMVLKPAPKTPLSALLLAEVLHEAKMPPGQVNILPFGHDHVPGLLRDPRIKMLSFTGSAAVGWRLKGEAVKMKVALELGGNAGVLIEPDSDWQNAIPKIATAAFGYAGQSCISVQRIIVHRSIFHPFRDAFVECVKAHVKTGDPGDRTTIVGPMINASARDKVVTWVEKARAGGAELLTPLQTADPNILHPLVITNAPATSEVVCEEAFAPLVVLDTCADFDEGLRKLNDSVYGLQAGVFTRDVTKAFRAFKELDVGGVMINQVPTYRVENMPYGGIKESGFGREGVRYAMEEMTELKSLVLHLG